MRAATQDVSVESLHWLDELQAAQRSVVGQTALGLTQLIQADCPVLPGVVLSAAALQQFCRSISWSSPFLGDFPYVSLRLQQEQPLQLQAIANEIYQGFKTTSIPPHWLQRGMAELQQLSSGCLRLSPSLALPQKWAEQTSQITRMLPIQYCQLTPGSVETAIKQVWSSLFTAQTLFLLQRLAIPIEQLQLGIIFQPVASAQAAGFLSVTRTHVQIQATYGLSQSIITGDVLPDVYSFDRQAENWQQDAGRITCTYQAPSAPLDQALSRTDSLVNTVLDPVPRQRFVLDAIQLEQLLTLAKCLPPSEVSPVVEWVLPTTNTEPISGLNIVSVWMEAPYPMPKVDSPPGLEDTNGTTPLITAGLAAADGRVTAPILVLKDRHLIQPQHMAGQIVVLDQVVPADLGWLHQASGLICTTGGHTSHGAIMARELGLPAVVGVASALNIFQSGQRVVLDGTQGKVYATTPSQGELINTTIPVQTDPTLEPLRTQVWVNFSQPKSLKRALQVPAQGVGLLRAEWFLLDICQGQPPADWVQEQGAAEFVALLSQQLQSFVQAWQPRPVFYRSLDIKNDALAGSLSQQPRGIEHSVLGLRGVSAYMYDSTLFDLELQALAHLYHQGCQNLRLILPFVRSVEEFQFCRDRIQATDLLDNIQIWIMAEVPSVLFQLPEYVAAGVQGIAIGTNDLTQLLLGVDREHTYLTQKYSANHPAVRAAMSQLAKTAQELGIPCSICGQALAQSPQLIQQFVEWGVTAISVDIAAVQETRVAIAIAEQQLRTKNNPTFNPSATQKDG